MDTLRKIKNQVNAMFISRMENNLKVFVTTIHLKEMVSLKQLMAMRLKVFGKIMY